MVPTSDEKSSKLRLLICTQVVDSEDPVLGFFHRWLLEFAKQCESVDIICLREGKHDLPTRVRVHSLGKERGTGRVGRLFRFYFFALRFLFRYDAVFIHMNPEYAILGWPIWKLAGKWRVLWYTHKSVDFKLRLGSRLVDTICTASSESFRLKRPNVVVTGHGIDTAVFALERPPMTDFLRLVVIGRITPSKGILTVFEALPELPRSGVPYQLLVVGAPATREDARYEQELRAFVEKFRLQQNVSFAGAKASTEIPKILATSDVLVHASTTGSLDKVVLEAMAAQCLVISSNDAAKPILGKIHADLVVPEPKPELFIRAITQVYRLGRDEREALGKQSRAIVERDHALPNLIERLVCTLKNK